MALNREDEDVERREGMDRGERAFDFLEREVWPTLPAYALGKRMTKEEEEEILGYGAEGV